MPHLVGHTNQCAISSSQVTLLEFVGTWRSSRRRFGLQSARLALSSSQQHHAPRAMHHAPPHSVLHRTRCAMHHWRISPCARHCALCTTHPSAYHILDGAVPPFTACLSPPCIISELTAGPPVHCPRVHVRYDAVSRWDDCSCVRVRLLLVTSLVSLSWSIPVNELVFPFHCLSPRVLGILARSHASPGS